VKTSTVLVIMIIAGNWRCHFESRDSESYRTSVNTKSDDRPGTPFPAMIEKPNMLNKVADML